MKRFLGALSILLVLLGISLVHAWVLQDLADHLTANLSAAEVMAERGAWEQARVLTGQAAEQWQDSHSYLHMFLNHTDTDEILVSFRAVEQYLKLEEMDQYAAANLELITRIELLAEMEQPSFLNVF